MPGKLIMISGIDGSGKSTAADIIKDYMSLNLKKKVMIVDAMKNGCYSCQLRNCVREVNDIRNKFSAELINLAWCADLIYTYKNIILPYIQEGYYVITHRSDLCCRVYSELFAGQDEIAQALINSVSIVPDVHFFMDISPETAYQRILSRNPSDGMKVKEEIEYLERADLIYRKILLHDRYKQTIFIKADVSRGTFKSGIIEYMDKIGI